MPGVSTTYTGGAGGGSVTSIPGTPGTDFGVGAGDDMSWIMDLAKRRALQRLKMGNLEYRSGLQALKDAQRARVQGHWGGPNPMTNIKDLQGQVMEGALAQSGAESMLRNRGIGDMMRAKDYLEGRPQLRTGGITGTEGFRHMPAAAALTGMSLPTSGFDVYANLAGAGAGPSSEAIRAASTNLQQLRDARAMGARTGSLPGPRVATPNVPMIRSQ